LINTQLFNQFDHFIKTMAPRRFASNAREYKLNAFSIDDYM